MNNWKPKKGERYWYLAGIYEIDCDINTEHLLDRESIKSDNCFRTKRLAQNALKRIKQVLKDCDNG